MWSSKENGLIGIFSLLVAASMLIFQGWDMLVEKGEPILTGYDDTGYFLWLNSWVIDGDNDLVNNLAETNTLNEKERQAWLSQVHPNTGKVLNKYPVGWAAVNVPAYQFCHWLSKSMVENPTGLEPAYFLAIWINQLLTAALGLYVTYLLLRRFLNPRSSTWAILIVWLASPLLYYQVARLGLVHSQAFSLTAVILWLSLKLKEENRMGHWLGLGACSGLLLITRPTSVCYLIIPAICCLNKLRTDFRASLPGFVLACLTGALPLVLQMAVWRDVYGSWLVYSYFGEPFYFLKPAFFGSLLSDRHGLFNWHPFLLAGLLGLLIGMWRERLFPPEWLAALIAITYLNSAWWCWWFGSSFGNRAYEGALLFFMAGTGYLKEQSRHHRVLARVLNVAAALAAAWNLYLLSQYMAGRFDRSLPVSYLERLTGWF